MSIELDARDLEDSGNLSSVLWDAGLMDEFPEDERILTSNGEISWVFRYGDASEWAVSLKDARRARNADLKNLQIGFRVDDRDTNRQRLLSFDAIDDDIASALQLFKGDVAAAAEYLKGQH